MTDSQGSGGGRRGGPGRLVLVAAEAGMGAGIVALLVTIFQHKQEERVPFCAR